MSDDTGLAYVRTEDAPLLPAPPATVGWQGWLRTNLFSNAIYSILTIVLAVFAVLVIWHVLDWAFIRAVWHGDNREACAGAAIGACWPFAWDKILQWVYGFFPIDQRWRVNLGYLLGIAGLAPMLIPSVPYKLWNALFLLIAYPIITLILLTGGHFAFGPANYGLVIALLCAAACCLPFMVFGLQGGMEKNRAGVVLAGLGLLPLIVGFALLAVAAIASFAGDLLSLVRLAPLAEGLKELAKWFGEARTLIAGIPYIGAISAGLLALGALVSLWLTRGQGGREGTSVIAGWAVLAAAVLAIMAILGFDFGLEPVDTQQWGGLLVTLVTSVTGIVASFPIGILLALGRRSQMPVVRSLSVGFIEVVRGVPLITVLFMSSVMLPLFLPPGVNFDKLLRVLIGTALFSGAYMAEVVRAGLQAIPRGQYEGAQALGLSYWQMMAKVILPQALKITIPSIVGSFISLFKDTTLVMIVGLYDLLSIIQAGFSDPKWVSPNTAATGYFCAALTFWVFCFSMSRYAKYMEGRLSTGRKR